MSSYGHAYLTSYGWTGAGHGLRKGALVRPLAIPPKKDLSGLGNDRDDAFPFWDHLFIAASKAITIKISSDDEDAGDHSHTDTLRRTSTGIISNRRPISGTPASTEAPTVTVGGSSLIAIAKREAAKRGLYARFFRGPVLGPDSAESSSLSSTPTPEHGFAKETRKRRVKESAETKEERRERKRLKKERKVGRAAKRAEKALATVTDVSDPKDKQTRSDENESSSSKKRRKRVRISLAGDGEPVLKEGHAPIHGEQDTPSNTTDTSDVVLTTKKRKRKDTVH